MTNRRNGGSEIQVLVSAASAVRRAGLESLLNKIPVRLAGGVYGISNLLVQVPQIQPDVILIDLEQSNAQFLAMAKSLNQVGATLGIVVLIDRAEPAWAIQAVRAGVKSIMPRDIDPEELIWAVQTAHSGLVLLDPATAQSITEIRQRGGEMALEGVDDLTPREVEVLRMMADGSGNKQIAADLGISEHTVKFHISSILEKLGASGRTEAVTLGIRRGYVLI
jgi:DNA-binding NarL/FixJ family response regulator